jgi:hypothetical protein
LFSIDLCIGKEEIKQLACEPFLSPLLGKIESNCGGSKKDELF